MGELGPALRWSSRPRAASIFPLGRWGQKWGWPLGTGGSISALLVGSLVHGQQVTTVSCAATVKPGASLGTGHLEARLAGAGKAWSQVSSGGEGWFGVGGEDLAGPLWSRWENLLERTPGRRGESPGRIVPVFIECLLYARSSRLCRLCPVLSLPQPWRPGPGASPRPVGGSACSATAGSLASSAAAPLPEGRLGRPGWPPLGFLLLVRGLQAASEPNPIFFSPFDSQMTARTRKGQ